MTDRPLEVEVGKIWKDRRRTDFLAVAIREYEGRVYVDIRQFFTAQDGRSGPTKRGVTISLPRLAEFTGIVNRALKTARELGLIREDGKRSEGDHE